jgi:hypothetical protein
MNGDSSFKELKMSFEKGLNMIDEALNLAYVDLKRRGMAKDEAQIAMLMRLRTSVSPEILQVTEILSNDDELNAAINPEKVEQEPITASL